MINVIISHDVDHLYGRDHWFRDLIYPKLWVKSAIKCIKKDISPRECLLRMYSCFKRNRHNIEALVDFDRKYGVDSTFFFGVKQGLGMSYKPSEAKKIINQLVHDGVNVGIHGIEYNSFEEISAEKKLYASEYGIEADGIRMHYVRFSQDTFENENQAGYIYDSTEFDKEKGYLLKNPYKIGNMWEFPLTIMDGYLTQNFEKAKEETLDILEKCKTQGTSFISILFHDYQFCDDFSDMNSWYRWLIEYLYNDENYKFVSFKKAIEELERN